MHVQNIYVYSLICTDYVSSALSVAVLDVVGIDGCSLKEALLPIKGVHPTPPTYPRKVVVVVVVVPFNLSTYVTTHCRSNILI